MKNAADQIEKLIIRFTKLQKDGKLRFCELFPDHYAAKFLIKRRPFVVLVSHYEDPEGGSAGDGGSNNTFSSVAVLALNKYKSKVACMRGGWGYDPMRFFSGSGYHKFTLQDEEKRCSEIFRLWHIGKQELDSRLLGEYLNLYLTQKSMNRAAKKILKSLTA